MSRRCRSIPTMRAPGRVWRGSTPSGWQWTTCRWTKATRRRGRKQKRRWNWIQTWPRLMQQWDGSRRPTTGTGPARMQPTSGRWSWSRQMRMWSGVQQLWQQRLAVSMRRSPWTAVPSNSIRSGSQHTSIWVLTPIMPDDGKRRKQQSGRLWS